MTPKHLLLLLAVALFAACNKGTTPVPTEPVQSIQKFASIVCKWLLTGSARVTVHYMNSGRDSTVKTDSLYNYDYNHKLYGIYTMNTYTDKAYITQDYDPQGNPTYSTTYTYTISGNNFIAYDKNNVGYSQKIKTLDEKNMDFLK